MSAPGVGSQYASESPEVMAQRNQLRQQMQNEENALQERMNKLVQEMPTSPFQSSARNAAPDSEAVIRATRKLSEQMSQEAKKMKDRLLPHQQHRLPSHIQKNIFSGNPPRSLN